MPNSQIQRLIVPSTPLPPLHPGSILLYTHFQSILLAPFPRTPIPPRNSPIIRSIRPVNLTMMLPQTVPEPANFTVLSPIPARVTTIYRHRAVLQMKRCIDAGVMLFDLSGQQCAKASAGGAARGEVAVDELRCD